MNLERAFVTIDMADGTANADTVNAGSAFGAMERCAKLQFAKDCRRR